MRPSRNYKFSGRTRMRQQSCQQNLRSTWPTIHFDNEDAALNGMTSFLDTMKANGIMPFSYSTENIHSPNFKNSRRNGRRSSSKTSSTPILQNFGDMDDTEDEGYKGRLSSVSYNILRRQATSMGSLSSSYSSLGERSSSTLSPLDDLCLKRSLSTSLKAILDIDFSGEFDYDQDPKMRETVEDIVSPKTTKTSRLGSASSDVSTSLTAVDPSILVALPGRGTNHPELVKYSPTALCDFTIILAASPLTEVDDSRSDLAQLRLGTHPVNDGDTSTRRGWDIPEEEVEEEVLMTKIPYRKLSETSESGEDCYVLTRHNLSQLSQPLNSSFGSTSRSRSSSLSSARDSSDYLADISGEDTVSKYITMWPPCKKLKIDLEEDGAPFALSPRIPGVDYYGVPTSNIAESPGRVSRGLDAFFNSRSIVHRLGPHGQEQVYDMESCPERCGFAYPVPTRQEVPT